MKASGGKIASAAFIEMPGSLCSQAQDLAGGGKNMKTLIHRITPILVILILAACNLQTSTPLPPVVISGGVTDTPGTSEPPITSGATDTQELPPAASETPTVTIEHLVTPGEGATTQSTIGDTISGDTARTGVTNQPPGGDMYHYNLYERPFNAFTQDIFFPDLDIRSAQLGLAGDWMYVTIQLYGLDPATSTLARHYGIELDLDVDGRGEWLIMAAAPLSDDWTTDGVTSWNDTDGDVGQRYACYDDTPQTDDSYDKLYVDSGIGEDPDAVWARYIGGTPPALQIAFKHSMIAYDNKFMWGVWADQGVDEPTWFDYHDHFTYAEAGSPFPYITEYYPIKAIAELDNTCRTAYGFIIVGDEPCLCAGNVKTPTPSPAPVAHLGGFVWKDLNGNRIYDGAGTDGGMGMVTVNIRAGACPGGAVVASAVTIEWGRYDVYNLPPGTYCVEPISPAVGIGFMPPNRQVTLSAGEFRDNVNFMVVFGTFR
jgi:hypothetical protein